MNFIKRGLVVTFAAAGLIVGSVGVASANSGHHGDEGGNINDSGNIFLEDLLDANVVVNDVLNHNDILNGNNVIVDDLLGGNHVDN